MLKAASKKNLKEMKTFVLRNVPTSKLSADVRSLTRKNFSRDVGEEFDVGYILGMANHPVFHRGLHSHNFQISLMRTLPTNLT